MEELRQFILNVKESDTLWLLEAKPGLFAMVEDGDENSYIPVWQKRKYRMSEDNAFRFIFLTYGLNQLYGKKNKCHHKYSKKYTI